MKKLVMALLLGSTPAFAQNARIEQNADVIQPRVGIALSAGNPVAGASSTLGMRIGSIPRISIAVRRTGVWFNYPDVRGVSTTATSKSLTHSNDVDVAVGIYSGKTLAPTIGGFASVDLLGSAGKLGMSDGDGFSTDPGSWAIGARLGIVRESFTMPGVAVSAMYRHIGDVRYGSGTTATQYQLRDNKVTSLRATVGKRLLVFGATAGIGLDKYSSKIDESFFVTGTSGPLSTYTGDLRNTRHTAFIDATWTMLVLNFVAEGGVQKGGDKNGYYGSLAARLVL